MRVPLLEGLEAIASSPGAVLVVCNDGISLGPALAIAQVACRTALIGAGVLLLLLLLHR